MDFTKSTISTSTRVASLKILKELQKAISNLWTVVVFEGDTPWRNPSSSTTTVHPFQFLKQGRQRILYYSIFGVTLVVASLGRAIPPSGATTKTALWNTTARASGLTYLRNIITSGKGTVFCRNDDKNDVSKCTNVSDSVSVGSAAETFRNLQKLPIWWEGQPLIHVVLPTGTLDVVFPRVNVPISPMTSVSTSSGLDIPFTALVAIVPFSWPPTPSSSDLEGKMEATDSARSSSLSTIDKK